MFLFDTIIIFLSMIQPILIGHLALFGLMKVTNFGNLNTNLSGIRSKFLVSRVYECATYSKLSSLFTYSLNTLSVLLVFLIYDIDLIFFFSEISLILTFGFAEILVILILIILFVFAICFDNKGDMFSWKL